MSTARDLITKSLFLGGAASPVNPASPELIQYSFEALIDMLVEWEAVGIFTGSTIPTVITDELNNPADTNQVIQHQLCVITMPLFRIEAPSAVQVRARELMNKLRINYAVRPVSSLPCTLPVGSGNEESSGLKFYGETDAKLINKNGLPL